MDRLQLAQKFLDHEPIPGVRFKHNDPVLVLTGEHAGMAGSLVTVIELLPEPKFVLELSSGADVEVLQSQLQRVDT